MTTLVDVGIGLGVAAVATIIALFVWDAVKEGDPARAAERTAQRTAGAGAGIFSVAITVALTMFLTAAQTIPEATALLVGIVGLGGISLGINIEMVAAVMLLVYILGAMIRDPSINSGGR